MARTSPKPSLPTCRESTSGQADSRVRTFLYLAGNEGLQASEALSFLKSLDSSKARLPKIDPKNKNYGKFGDAYLGIQLVTLLFLAAITGICITEALRPGTVNVSGVVCLLVSLMMVYLGNVMPRFRMNWYCGVKNPWTLSSEAVWTRTHRIAGRMFFASGLLGAAGAFLPDSRAKFAMLFVPLALAVIVPTVFSWKIYREEQEK